MNKKMVALLLLLLATLPLSGCWDNNEPERMLYLNGIGIDYKDGRYELYAQIINFANTAKSEQPTSDETSQAEVGHASGMSLDEAVFELYHSVDQKVNWGHLSYLVFSEEALQQVKLSPVLDIFIRYRETRYQIWLYATKDPVEEVLLIRPVVNKAIILSKLGDPRNSFEQESFIKPASIREVLINMNEPNHETLIPFITIAENWKSIKETIKAPVISGAAIVSPDDFKGFITGEKAGGIRWMTNDTKRSNLTVRTENGNFISVVLENIKVKINPVMIKGEAKFDIDIYADGIIDIITETIKPAEIEKLVKEIVKEQIATTYEEALKMDADIYRLSEQLYRKNVKEWKRLQKDGKIELAEDSIRNINITIGKLSSNKKTFERTVE
ncbi:Ger(x)C family spore germination protein [Sporosarcina luteola]|uniref:Ger(x)C family spore germination protein n=1 Tax=Sporosarcina luteola TaxID=582850 RepID=UPI002040B625|nr:Ger(x)C family spore germination protein [Sporosarcina luteola]MCM3709057.1 Ger(x)C family spore germination protein [Sporosarcina luteola]